MNNQPLNTETILEEILPTPSNQIINNRFAVGSEMASCNGRCKSGTCQ